ENNDPAGAAPAAAGRIAGAGAARREKPAVEKRRCHAPERRLAQGNDGVHRLAYERLVAGAGGASAARQRKGRAPGAEGGMAAGQYWSLEVDAEAKQKLLDAE